MNNYQNKKLPVFFTGSFFLLCLLFSSLSTFGQQAFIDLKVEVQESNGTPVAFSYVVNKTSGQGTVTDIKGICNIKALVKDSLVVSHVGYQVQRVAISSWKDSIRNNTLKLRVVLFEKVYQMAPVVVRSFDFTKVEKDYYKRIAEAPAPSVGSPVSYFYDMFSHEGKVKRKMQDIYEGILLEEMISERIDDDKVRKITGNPKMTLDSIRKICFIPDHFILSSSEYDLYKRINDCYTQNKKPKLKR
jgi:hypothetical protein